MIHKGRFLIATLMMAIVMLVACAAKPTRGNDAAATEPQFVWEGQLGAAGAENCAHLEIDDQGEVMTSRCNRTDIAYHTLPQIHADEWAAMQTRFATFEADTDNGAVVFNGTGSSDAPAWQDRIASWGELVYSELTADQVGAAGATAFSWQVGELQNDSAVCNRLNVTTYGYAYAQTEPCAGGAALDIKSSWLNDTSAMAFDRWLETYQPVYNSNNYLAGSGTVAADDAAVQAIAAWADITYSELAAQQVSATGPTMMRWNIGQLAGDNSQCEYLTVLSYGYASAEIAPCAGGVSQAQSGDILDGSELDALLDMSNAFAPIYSENNYLDGKGQQQADDKTITDLDLLARRIHARIKG